MRHGQGAGAQGRAAAGSEIEQRSVAGAEGVELDGADAASVRGRSGLSVVVLSIAGSDSSGGAGVAADLKTLAAHGVHGASVVTLVSAQSTTALGRVDVLPAASVRAQIDAVAGDLEIAAVKLGALGSVAIVEAVVAAIDEHGFKNVVIDPVGTASVGGALNEDGVLEALRENLLPRATVVTPNLAEAAALCGEDVETVEQMEAAARKLVELGATAALVTGGHLEATTITDVLYHGEVRHLTHPRVETTHTHGTGCTLASAIAAGLARGVSIPAAASRGVRYVERALRAAPGIGHGNGPLGYPPAES